ncbi:hypothetical protein EDD85DRAFT_789697 [Armillaria nabsnona]|nr:hypothetical protein EDD85DRAFT_789697 [Armillaria nabsnona]
MDLYSHLGNYVSPELEDALAADYNSLKGLRSHGFEAWMAPTNMKKYPDFEYNTDKDLLEGEVWMSLNWMGTMLLWRPYQTSRMKSAQWEGNEVYKDIIRETYSNTTHQWPEASFWFMVLPSCEKQRPVWPSHFQYVQETTSDLGCENKNQATPLKWVSCIDLYFLVFVFGSHLRGEYIHEQDESVQFSFPKLSIIAGSHTGLGLAMPCDGSPLHGTLVDISGNSPAAHPDFSREPSQTGKVTKAEEKSNTSLPDTQQLKIPTNCDA